MIQKNILKKKNIYFEFIELMKRCWNHNPNERPDFYEITITLQEIFEVSENIKK
jgi:hypothetical protein